MRLSSRGTGPVRRAAALVAVCLITLAGCSGSGDGGGSAGTPPAPASSAPMSSSAPAGQALVTIDNFTFTPARLTVDPGTKVTVTNKDSVAHTVTATAGKAFDTGTVDPGATVTFTAPAKAGDYPYLCSIHPFMKGTLTVR
ncbi:cupredoxin family copper-binding protein [Streptomyces sp. NPDC087658]|uniref:cupredoxin domain-containing protein n=1 Tax=Streptomyces sp. NPDC087658 TaxID=3365800 RepID=UPI0037F7573A